MSRWSPSLGAVVRDGGTRFRVWAPAASTLMVDIEEGGAAGRHPLTRDDDGYFFADIKGVTPGTRYRYRLNGGDPLPDPASRYQPDGVHGASMAIDPQRFEWSDGRWRGVPLADLVIYELHVGTFTESGTFDAAAARLSSVRDLGATAIEVMPIADFPGRRNWGYDGVALFAPARCYGAPEGFRRFVDHAHALGLAVLLDVVYNHLGPDGAYLTRFSSDYFTDRDSSPWGAAVNLDGRNSAHVRGFFIENALHWLHEYHLDGVRLDATHALHDQGGTHFLAELSSRLHESVDRQVHVIAEDDRNLARMVTPQKDGGWGLDAVWADDFHHQMRRALAGDADGYYADYTGAAADIATTIRQGWFYTGGFSRVLRAPRGTSPEGVAPQQCVVCLQNHDQIGNRAFGDRLHHRISAAPYRAASTLLLLLPETPLLFMGQEWAASSPFLYFTDHHAELGRLVTEGRRREFRAFAAFANAAVLQSIPDPQADATFESSRLDWSEATAEPHVSIARLYSTLLTLRRELSGDVRDSDAASARAIGEDAIALRRRAANGDAIVVCVRLRGNGPVALDAAMAPGTSRWSTVLTSEDTRFARDGNPPAVDLSSSTPVIDFRGPAAVVLRAPPGTAR